MRSFFIHLSDEASLRLHDLAALEHRSAVAQAEVLLEIALGLRGPSGLRAGPPPQTEQDVADNLFPKE